MIGEVHNSTEVCNLWLLLTIETSSLSRVPTATGLHGPLKVGGLLGHSSTLHIQTSSKFNKNRAVATLC